jgi:hypothetical protein
MGSLRNETQLRETGEGDSKGNPKEVKVCVETQTFAMLPLAIWLNCAQANTLIARVIAHQLPLKQEAALIREIKSVSPKHCEWRL